MAVLAGRKKALVRLRGPVRAQHDIDQVAVPVDRPVAATRSITGARAYRGRQRTCADPHGNGPFWMSIPNVQHVEH